MRYTTSVIYADVIAQNIVKRMSSHATDLVVMCESNSSTTFRIFCGYSFVNE